MVWSNSYTKLVLLMSVNIYNIFTCVKIKNVARIIFNSALIFDCAVNHSHRPNIPGHSTQLWYMSLTRPLFFIGLARARLMLKLPLAMHCCIGSYTFSVKSFIGETLLLPSTESEALSEGKELSTEVVAVAISWRHGSQNCKKKLQLLTLAIILTATRMGNSKLPIPLSLVSMV